MTPIEPNKPEPFNSKIYISCSEYLGIEDETVFSFELDRQPGAGSSREISCYFCCYVFDWACIGVVVHVDLKPPVARYLAGVRNKITQEFVPSDHVLRAGCKLRNLRHENSVANFLTDFRNISLNIQEMNDRDKWDRFISGLKN